MGQWIHTDNYDSVNEINNTILTIFAVINLLNYYYKSNSSIFKKNLSGNLSLK